MVGLCLRKVCLFWECMLPLDSRLALDWEKRFIHRFQAFPHLRPDFSRMYFLGYHSHFWEYWEEPYMSPGFAILLCVWGQHPELTWVLTCLVMRQLILLTRRAVRSSLKKQRFLSTMS